MSLSQGYKTLICAHWIILVSTKQSIVPSVHSLLCLLSPYLLLLVLPLDNHMFLIRGFLGGKRGGGKREERERRGRERGREGGREEREGEEREEGREEGRGEGGRVIFLICVCVTLFKVDSL